MKLSREERLGIALAVENSSEELKMSDKDRKLLRKISRYIATFQLSEYEVEEIRKELIGISEQARMRGEHLEEAIGMDYEKFCNEMITAVTEIEIPPRYKRLRVTGTFLIIGGIWNLLAALLALYFFIPMCLWERGFRETYYHQFWLYICYLLFITSITGVLALLGGIKGRLKCGNVMEAKKCFRYGAVLLVLHTGATLADIIRTMLWGPWNAMEIFQFLYIGSLIVIFTILILYTKAARQNMQTGKA